jgi:hypothetical protein
VLEKSIQCYLDLLTIFRFLWVNLQLLSICKQRSDQDIEAELGNIPRGLIVHMLEFYNEYSNTLLRFVNLLGGALCGCFTLQNRYI